MLMTCVGIIITASIIVKNGWRIFHSYATSEYAVRVEKYTAQAVAPVAMITEFTKPVNGLKVFPVSTFQFSKMCVVGTRETACC